jgi:hypothetical protein
MDMSLSAACGGSAAHRLEHLGRRVVIEIFETAAACLGQHAKDDGLSAIRRQINDDPRHRRVSIPRRPGVMR